MTHTQFELYRRSSFSWIAAVVFIITAAFPVHAAKPDQNQPQPVIVAPVQVQQISDRIEALGTARANELVTISANVSEKVARIYFDDGQQVKAGDVLVDLQKEEELANLQQAKALLAERKLVLQRLLRLEKQKNVSIDELDKAKQSVEQAKASISAVQARINDRIIRAPFDGIVGLRQISVGTLVETGDPITTLDDIHLIKLDFTVPEIYLSELKPGLKIRARASASPDHIYDGEIKSIDSRVDPVSRSVRVRALLPNNEGQIIPGVLMQIDILRNTRHAMLIPEAALLPLADKHFVMVRAQKDGKEVANKRLVTIGTRLPGLVEVVSGLAANDQVITHGNDKVKPGGLIRILAVDDGSQDIETIIKAKPAKGN